VVEHGIIQEVSAEVVNQLCTLAQYSSDIFENPPGQEAYHDTSFLVRVIDDIAHRRNIPGLKPMNTSLTGFLKTGLGRIGLQQHHPGEYDNIVIFVLGGISLNEASEIFAHLDRLAAHWQQEERNLPRIIVGGSSLLHCGEAFSSIFS